MSNSERKARKRAGKKFEPKPAKTPTGTYASKSDLARARRASQAWLDDVLRQAAADLKAETEAKP